MGSVDFGRTARDYGRHRAGFPDPFFNRLVHFGVGLPGQRVIDLGCGTGSLTRGFAMRGSKVVGVDPSERLLEEARRLDREVGVVAHYVIGTAEDTRLPDDVCEVVTAGQSWHWFDRPRAVAEVRRILVPGGRLVIAHFDWLPLPGNVVEATEAVIQAHNSRWTLAGGTGIYPQWLSDVACAGFENIQTFSFDVVVPYSQEDWRGRIRASAGVGASLEPEHVARFDEDLEALLSADYPAEPLAIPHRVWAVISTAP